MTSPFSEDAMRARFHDLTARAEAIRAVSTPLREARDTKVNAAREAENAMNAEIKAAEAGLFEIDNERAALARALKGQTGEPGGVAPVE